MSARTTFVTPSAPPFHRGDALYSAEDGVWWVDAVEGHTVHLIQDAPWPRRLWWFLRNDWDRTVARWRACAPS